MQHSQCLLVMTLLAASIGMLTAQQQPPGTPYVPKQCDRPKPSPETSPPFNRSSTERRWRDGTGIRSIGELKMALVGEITPATVMKSNTFIIWRGGSRRFRVEVRLSDHGERKQWDQLPQCRGARSSDAREQVRLARISIRLRWRKRYPWQQLRRKRPAVLRCVDRLRMSLGVVCRFCCRRSVIPTNWPKPSQTIGTPST